MSIILVGGYAGSGKSTVAKLISEELVKRGASVFQDSFAREVKRVAKECFGWDEVKNVRGRRLLQQVGKIGREYNEDIWVEKVFYKWVEYGKDFFLVIDDWRFPNEQFYLLEHADVVTIRVNNNRIDLSDPMYEDISETSLCNDGDYDFTIENHSDMETLQFMCNRIVTRLLEKEKQV